MIILQLRFQYFYMIHIELYLYVIYTQKQSNRLKEFLEETDGEEQSDEDEDDDMKNNGINDNNDINDSNTNGINNDNNNNNYNNNNNKNNSSKQEAASEEDEDDDIKNNNNTLNEYDSEEDLILSNNKSFKLKYKIKEIAVDEKNKNNNIDISYPSEDINPLINLIGSKLKINHNYGILQYNTKGTSILFDSNGYLNVSIEGEGLPHPITAKLAMAPLTKTIKNIDYSNQSNDVPQYVPRGHVIPDCNYSNYFMFSTVSDLVCIHLYRFL